MLTDRPAEQVGLEGVVGCVLERGQVGDRVPADHTGDRGRAGDQRGERTQETTGGRPPQVGAFGHDAQLTGVIVEPAQRLDDVVDLGGEVGLGR